MTRTTTHKTWSEPYSTHKHNHPAKFATSINMITQQDLLHLTSATAQHPQAQPYNKVCYIHKHDHTRFATSHKCNRTKPTSITTQQDPPHPQAQQDLLIYENQIYPTDANSCTFMLHDPNTTNINKQTKVINSNNRNEQKWKSTWQVVRHLHRWWQSELPDVHTAHQKLAVRSADLWN